MAAGVKTLNALGGRGRSVHGGPPARCQRASLEALSLDYAAVPDCPPDVSRKGAPRRVLGCEAGYGELNELTHGSHAAYQPGRKVALPSVRAGHVISRTFLRPAPDLCWTHRRTCRR